VLDEAFARFALILRSLVTLLRFLRWYRFDHFQLVMFNLLHAPAQALAEGRSTSIHLAQACVSAGLGDRRKPIDAL
jgi:hypothetical protein